MTLMSQTTTDNKFEKEFSKEILLSERFRLFIVAAIFLIIVFYLLTLLFLGMNQVQEKLNL